MIKTAGDLVLVFSIRRVDGVIRFGTGRVGISSRVKGTLCSWRLSAEARSKLLLAASCAVFTSFAAEKS